MRSKKHLIWTIIIASIATFINVFIIVQSCLNGVKSTSSSSLVVDIFKGIINFFNKDAINESNIGTFTQVIRKVVGHFGLFVLSGFFTSLAIHLGSYYLKKYQWLYGFAFTLFFGLFLAGLTELIQSFIPTRSGEIRDVLIDFSGFIVGLGFASIINYHI